MRAVGPNIELSASDLSYFLACRHRSALDLAVARGLRSAPDWIDPAIEILRQRGLEHERRYTDRLRAQGLAVAELAAHEIDGAAERSIEAMRAGADVILQPALRNASWFGRPDLLRRVAKPSALGSWSYEVHDTKLANETSAGTILQLALYSDLLANVQGLTPEFFHVVTPNTALQTYRFDDFSAYFRLVRRRLESTVSIDPRALLAANYPEPVKHCDVCRWWRDCDRRRREDDHLSLVAGMSRLHAHELERAGLGTLTQLGGTPLSLDFKPVRGARESYERMHDQARVQLAGRIANAPVHELLPSAPDRGFSRLPLPSTKDLFLDIEGDPFARPGGREYLFGLARADNTYHKYWALTDDEERTAFEAIIDAILESWAAAPTMHVYHFAPYEPAALKRLMGRYATREAEIDRLLRAGLFVDIHTVVKQAMRASVEQYSLKDLEPFYSFARAVPLAEARTALRVTARALELDAPDAITREIRCTVEGYNRDDCVSAARLREWLEALRADAEKRGFWFARPGIATGDAPESVDERERKTQALRAALTADLPIEGRTSEQQARWLLANLLDFHRRESKAPWWEFFRLRDLSDDELFDERAAIAGLRFVERIPMKRSALHRYTYPAQDTDIRKDDELHSPDGDGFGRVGAIDRVGRLLDVKKSTKAAARDPSAVFAHTIVNTNVLADALARLAEDVLVHGIESDGDYAAAKQLLLAAPPRLRRAPFLMSDHESAVDFAVRVGSDLDRTVLAIQGPPGAGKTFTGARMIADLVARGLRVGVSAVSHKVIRTLLRGAVDAGRAAQVDVRCAHKINEVSDDADGIEEFKDNDDALKHLQAAYVVGGTAWLWARAEMRSAVDVLFIDEAGQMSLAQALASSQAATSVVLLGDPQQLDQPQRGSHPDGTDVAALEHMLGGSKTIARDRGIFLPETWRLAPAICGFTSELFYEGRLRARTGLERQALVGTDGMDGAGLWLLPVDHTGNRNSSTEEVDAIEHFLSSLVRPSACWIDADGKTHALTVADLLIVAPYNAHVALLEERFAARNIRVGTVDKFQGQEAPVIIYSMATSTPEDAPRGMEFLYSLHRLNVASSRARCACIVVASPRLFEPECKTPRQMQLANALCRYVECARTITL